MQLTRPLAAVTPRVAGSPPHWCCRRQAEIALRGSAVSEATLKTVPQSMLDAIARLRAQITAQEIKLASLRTFIRDVLDLEPVPDELAIPKQGPVRGGGAGARGGNRADAGGKVGGGGRSGGGGGSAGGGGVGTPLDDADAPKGA